MFSAELTNAWHTVQPAKTQEFIDLPEGRYLATIDAIKLNPPKKVNDKIIPEILVYELTVSDGEYQDSRFRKEDGIWTDKSLSFIKRDLLTLGCSIPRELEDVPLALQTAVGLTVEIEIVKTTKNGREYTNTYIRRVVNQMKPSAPQAASQFNPQQGQFNPQQSVSPMQRYNSVVQQAQDNHSIGDAHDSWSDMYDQSCPF